MTSEHLKSSCSIWYVYLIRTRFDYLYCGITTDVSRRYLQHCQGSGAKSLKGKGPLTLEWFEAVGKSRSTASKYEYRIKKLSKALKEKLIQKAVVLDELIDIEET
ncbi:GIY-YIG nuclease family protein [Vibrio sp. OCN044]|uniref:GIY-YIG nuclease family protein n=1 Tax=Vibrio tetraodonis subsp. pristinus TaxID=2695891 RepID=A0A6L8LW50_9VIBR|nr:GIY-YIG nuclease family protein [Vibrio tetraodonis]MYM60328.1 GIY-YIG nuclease family protein [Vibrio tetraodonis subsp. pristinus]